MQKKPLIIIGAGAAGLMAANELARKFDVTILEAQGRAGGRIHTIDFGKTLVEAGAEFIHGDASITKKLLKKASIPYLEVDGKMLRNENGNLTEEHEMIEGWNGLIKKMKAVKNDMTLLSFLNEYYPGAGHKKLREHVIKYASGFDLADPADASVYALYKEWNSGNEEAWRIPSGYSSLIAYLQKQIESDGCKLLLNTTVTSIEWNEGNVKTITDSGEMFTAEKLLVTVPVSLLNSGSKSGVQFQPPLTSYNTAAANIGFGSIVKVVIEFTEQFWPADTAFIFSDEKYFPTWWTQLPDKSSILTGWSGGPAARDLSGKDDENIQNEAIQTLAKIFDKPLDEIKNKVKRAKVFNWQKVPTAVGGYSYSTLYSAGARKQLCTPVRNTIFFAGEGLYSGPHPGTVEAAFSSGIEAARRIMEA